MTLILSLDCAGQACAVCVAQDDEILAVAEERMERGQDARLVPLVQEIMAQANTTFERLDRIAVTRGPGSFTGLRIGLATARGFGLAANKPVVGIDRFSIYREQHKTTAEDLLVVLESKRLELYCRFYPAHDDPDDAAMMTPEEIKSFLQENSGVQIVGDATNIVCEKAAEPEVITCAKLAARAQTDDPDFLPRPFYLRAPDVTMKQ